MNAGYEPHEVEELMQGGTRTRSAQTHQAQQVLGAFQKVGWNRSFLSRYFAHLDDDMLEGWQTHVFVEEYAKYLVRKSLESRNLLEVFRNMGLHTRIAKHLERICSPLLEDSYTFHQVLDVGIEWLLGKYRPLTPPNVPYFLEANQTSVWIPYETKRILNLPFTCQKTNVQQLQTIVQHEFSNQTLFFHVTNWASVASILKHVTHMKGRTCLDFGYAPGFYMSETLDLCVDWGEKRSGAWSNEVAIVVFSLPPISSRFKHKSLQGAEWSQIVRASRDCEGDNESVFQMERTYDFVYGPMMANVRTYREEGPKTHVPTKMQLVSKSHKGDSFLTKHIQGALVFRK
jgi:hypothetical protein